MGGEKYKNAEGYADPTAGAAMSAAMKEFRAKSRRRFADRNRRRVYVASRLSGDVKINLRAARRYCRMVVDGGDMPIAPHLLYPQFLADGIREERELGMAFGLALLALCDEVRCFGEISDGMRREIAEAERLNKRVRYFDANGIEKPKR